MNSRMTEWARKASLTTPENPLVLKKGPLAIMAGVEPALGGLELHVSISCRDRYPTWEEIKAVRAMFWHDEADVVMFLAPKSEYVNLHENCFHLYGDPDGYRRWKLGTMFDRPINR